MKDLVAHFGLKRYHFDKGVRTREVVDTGPLRECTARLEFIKRRGGILLLTGDPGVGKILALRRFADSLNENLFRPLYTPLSTLNRVDLLRHVNDRLGLPRRATKSTMYAQIQRELLDSREQKGRTIVLIIDEAHLLQVGPLQELRLLTNFKMDSFEPFILILAGQSELKRVMDYSVLEALAQRLALCYHMAPLNSDETGAYVTKQLELSGANEPIFDEGAFGALHQVSYGLPRRIGAVAEQAMTYAMFDDRRCVDADVVLKAQAPG